MGKEDKRNGGSDEEARTRPLSDQYVSPERPDMKSHSVTETRDQATLARSLGDAIERATAQQRHSYEVVDKSLDRAYNRIEELQKTNASLVERLAIVSAQNVSSVLAEGQARNVDTETREKWETARAVIAQLGPQAAPFLGHIAHYLGPKLAVMSGSASAAAPNASDKSPRACALRLFAKLGDGSEESGIMISMLADLAGDEWSLCFQFLTESAGTSITPPPAAESSIGTSPPIKETGPNPSRSTARAKRAAS